MEAVPGLVTFVGVQIAMPMTKARAAAPKVSFSEHVLPLLKWRCGAGKEKSGLDLTSYDGFMKRTKFGRW